MRSADFHDERPALTPFLFFAALLGGALNAVAGGGSFITLPALLYAGVPPVVANATNTFALWPASVASAWAYRRDMRPGTRWMAALWAVSLAGGFVGGMLLIRTSDSGFLRLLPWLMLLAATTFTFSQAITGRFRQSPAAFSPWALVLMFSIAVYGGYFGGGMGIMILAALSAARMTNLHEMNGVKAVLAVMINGVALAEFIVEGAIVWQPGFVMAAGSILGGYAGASLARQVDQRYVRACIVVVAWTLTLYFFLW